MIRPPENSWHFCAQLTLRIPANAIDQIWLAGLLDTWTAPGIPVPPSPAVVDNLVHTKTSLRALAACHPDTDIQAKVLRTKVPAAVDGLEHNPFLDLDGLVCSASWFQERTTFVATMSGLDDDEAAAGLVERLAGRQIASDLDADHPRGMAAWRRLRRATGGSEADLRYAVLSMTVRRDELFDELVCSRDAIIDWRCFEFVAAAVGNGSLSVDDVVCRRTAECGWTELGFAPTSTTAAPKHSGRVLDLMGTYEALRLIDPVAASREVLGCWTDLSRTDIVDVLENADTDTVTDWLSGELSVQPEPELLDDVLASLSPERFGAVGVELAGRPEAFTTNPHLAGFANPMSNQLSPAGVGVIAMRLRQALGDDEERWMFAATLLRNGWDGMAAELAELAMSV